GESISCGQVVNAAGAWAGRLAALAGVGGAGSPPRGEGGGTAPPHALPPPPPATTLSPGLSLPAGRRQNPPLAPRPGAGGTLRRLGGSHLGRAGGGSGTSPRARPGHGSPRFQLRRPLRDVPRRARAPRPGRGRGQPLPGQRLLRPRGDARPCPRAAGGGDA